MPKTTVTRRHIWPSITFGLIIVIGAAARWAIGDIYSAALARDLLDALSRAGLYLGSAIATASATIIALMLTFIGLFRRMDDDFDLEAYRNVDLVAKLATISLIISLIVLLAFVLPVGEFDELPNQWYSRLYDVLFAGCVVMVACIAATVVMIYRTLNRVMAKVTPTDDV